METIGHKITDITPTRDSQKSLVRLLHQYSQCYPCGPSIHNPHISRSRLGLVLAVVFQNVDFRVFERFCPWVASLPAGFGQLFYTSLWEVLQSI